MGGRGGAPMKAAPAANAEPVAPTGLPRLKPKDLREGMWVYARNRDNTATTWQQIGSVRNKGRAGRNTFSQFEIRDKQGDLITRLSPNASLIVDPDRS